MLCAPRQTKLWFKFHSVGHRGKFFEDSFTSFKDKNNNNKKITGSLLSVGFYFWVTHPVGCSYFQGACCLRVAFFVYISILISSRVTYKITRLIKLMTFRSYHTKRETKISDLHLPARSRISLLFFIWYFLLGFSYFSLLHFIILRGEISIAKRLKNYWHAALMYLFLHESRESLSRFHAAFFLVKGKKPKFLTRINFHLRGSCSFTFQVVYSVQLCIIVLFTWN